MDRCPSAFAMDDAELHGGAAATALAPHLAECDRCQGHIAARASLASRFDDKLARPLLASLRQAVNRDRARRRRWWMLAVTAVPAAALGAALAFGPVRLLTVAPYSATKGDVAVELSARRGGRVFAVNESTVVQEGDELQLTIRGPKAAGRTAVVGSVDGTGRFSPFYPASLQAPAATLPEAGVPLSPPVLLDGAPGPERVVVVIAERPLDVASVAALAEAEPGGPTLARTLGAAGPVIVRWTVLRKAGPGVVP